MHLSITTLLLATSATLSNAGRVHSRDSMGSNHQSLIQRRSVEDALASMKHQLILASAAKASAAMGALTSSSSHSSSDSSSSSNSNSGSSSSSNSDGVTYASGSSPVVVEAIKQVSSNSNSNSNSGSSGSGLYGFNSDNCGPSGADDSNPNGSQWFLNCGISTSDKNSGWTPPNGITLGQLKVVSLESALQNNYGTWGACSKFVPLFNEHGWSSGIPPILLASIALQESSCNQWASGDNGGAHGLMQITSDKCSSGIDCSDPSYNIKTAAYLLKSLIENSGGNVVKALGQYNGWQPGMSVNSATAAAYGECCQCQNNLDYIYQLLNGWILGKNGGSMGSYRNLNKCASSN